MTTLNSFLNWLRRMMQGLTTKDIAKACGVDVLTVRKVRNNVKIDTLKAGSLRKIQEGLLTMRGVADND